MNFLEWVSYAEVETECIKSRGYVEIGFDRLSGIHLALLVVLECLERCMYSHSKVKTNDQPVKVETQTGTRT